MFLVLRRGGYLGLDEGVLLQGLDELGEGVVELVQGALGDRGRVAREDQLADLVADARGDDDHLKIK